MTHGDIRSVEPSDVSSTTELLSLNNAHARELSWLEPERFHQLLLRAFLARRISGDAFLLAFDQDTDYDSPNFMWFRARYSRFVYVDRIAVAPAARGRGYARRLYNDLFQHATAVGYQRVVCEVNSDPPNPESDAFHAALGFAEVGQAAVYGGARTVRYLSRMLVVP
jgi:predicted GNAT superfamily acetyltransferase